MPARYITGKSPVAGVSARLGVAVEEGVWLVWAVTTSTLAAVSSTVTVSLRCWVREVELVGVAVACEVALLPFNTPQAAKRATSAIKKAAHKKRFNAKTPPSKSHTSKRTKNITQWIVAPLEFTSRILYHMPGSASSVCKKMVTKRQQFPALQRAVWAGFPPCAGAANAL